MTDAPEKANNQPNDKSIAVSSLAVFSEIPGAKLLLEQVDKLQQESDIRAIERLRDEITLLQNCIARYGRHWQPIFKLLREAFEATVLMEIALEELREVSADAEADWNSSLQPVDVGDRQNESFDT